MNEQLKCAISFGSFFFCIPQSTVASFWGAKYHLVVHALEILHLLIVCALSVWKMLLQGIQECLCTWPPEATVLQAIQECLPNSQKYLAHFIYTTKRTNFWSQQHMYDLFLECMDYLVDAYVVTVTDWMASETIYFGWVATSA